MKLKIKEIKFCWIWKKLSYRSQWVGSRDVNEVFQQPNLLTFVFENEFEWSTTRWARICCLKKNEWNSRRTSCGFPLTGRKKQNFNPHARSLNPDILSPPPSNFCVWLKENKWPMNMNEPALVRYSWNHWNLWAEAGRVRNWVQVLTTGGILHGLRGGP